MHTLLITVLGLLVVLAGCGDDAREGDPDGGHDKDSGHDGGHADSGTDSGLAMCEPVEGDYVPGADDGYAACVSDDGMYHRVEESISTIGRVEAFEEIAALLFEATSDAAEQDFLDARLIYQEMEGLDSRVVRRYNPHFTVPDGTDCTMADVPAMFPDYCVGPGILQPILLDAFNEGITGNEPRTQAARIEAALLWFFYASTVKESLTCTDVAKDCDSAYAYYTGGEPKSGGIGLARYIKDVDPAAHDRAWDGALAVRCWRDLDAAAVATDLALRERARTQYDRALIDGVAAILIDRLEKLDASTGDEQAYYLAFVKTLGPAVDYEAQKRDKAAADLLAAEFAKTTASSLDVEAAIEVLESVFDCP